MLSTGTPRELINRRSRTSGQSGFTLIELLVVIAVLAILAAIVIFNVVGVANKGSNASACTDQKSVQTAIDAAINANVTGFAAGAMTTAEWNLLVPAYIHNPPAGSGLTGAPADYGAGVPAPAWTLAGSSTAGWTVTNGINGC